MKIKIICLLAVLVTGLAASPNRCCYKSRCTGKSGQQAAIRPAKAVAAMIDEVELLPIHQYFSNF